MYSCLIAERKWTCVWLCDRLGVEAVTPTWQGVAHTVTLRGSHCHIAWLTLSQGSEKLKSLTGKCLTVLNR